MKIYSGRIEMRTSGKGTYEITGQVEKELGVAQVKSGTVTIFVQHTSCSLVIMENAAPAARRDLERFFDQMVPEQADYEHDEEGPDDMPSHIRMALTRTSETIPIVGGKMQLGTWQGVFLFEHRADSHRRCVALTIMGER